MKRTLFTIFTICFALFISIGARAEVAANVMTIQMPRIDRNEIKNNATEAFMTIQNNGKQIHKVVAAFSPIATQIQLHKTSKSKKHATEQIANIIIQPHQQTQLKLNGAHITLIGIKEKLHKGQTIPIAILYDDGSWTTLFAKVS